MGVLDKFLDAIKLNDEDEEYLDDDLMDDDDDEFLDDDDMDEKPKKKFFEKFSKRASEDDFEEYDLDEDETPAKSTVKSSAKTAAAKAAPKQEKPSRPAASSKITPMRSSKRSAAQSPNMEVCVIKPTSMEDTREIADTLVDNSTVILNLEGIDVELAQRIIDFTSGA